MASSGTSTSSIALNEVQNWKKAREFVNTGEIAWTDKVSVYGETSLHLAVGEFKDIEVAKDILKGIRPGLLITMADNPYRMNPAHHAALASNTEALKIMVDCNPDCVHIPDDRYYLPIGLALIVPHINTFLYLFEQTKTRKSDYDKMCEGGRGCELLDRVIDEGLIDVPIKNNSFGSTSTDTTTDIENQVTTKNVGESMENECRVEDVLSKIISEQVRNKLLTVKVKRSRNVISVADKWNLKWIIYVTWWNGLMEIADGLYIRSEKARNCLLSSDYYEDEAA
ncbi:ankyrin repeat family protein [Tanacetum coccineum]